MDRQALFHKVFDAALAAGAFADTVNTPHWATNAGPDIRVPRYEGDFATSTDASFLLMKGVAVPQAAMNATRVSVAKALDHVMPDWAVAEWLQHFLKECDYQKIKPEIEKLREACIKEIPQAGRFPAHDFDYRVASCPWHRKTAPRGKWIFSQSEVALARSTLLNEKNYVLGGVLLWQYALQCYAEELKKVAEGRGDVPEKFRLRFVEFCTFLAESALRLASFGALLPMAIVIDEEMGAAEAMSTFSTRGGFVKRMYVDVPALFVRFVARFFTALRRKEKPPVASYETQFLAALITAPAPRMGVCAAAEALVRWASLFVKDGHKSLTAYVEYAKNRGF